MKKTWLILSLLSVTIAGIAQNKRALVIGIDAYIKTGISTRSTFGNLKGCRNDAMAMASLLNVRFGFPVTDIDTIYDEAATRSNIIAKMIALKDQCNKGDIAFIFYAGHGSQVFNKKSKEADQRDETIVPADFWKEGVKDIRDKELAAIFNQFLDKGIQITVIMDCCHSGSLSRGPQQDIPAFRYMSNPDYAVEDSSDPAAPELRPGNDFLIMSASQDNELAAEQSDDNNIPHGAFTIALIEALKQQGTDASAISLFSAIRAILKSNGQRQEPVISGSKERQQQTLLGLKKGTIPDRSVVAVSSISNNTVELQGGFAIGLHKENELVKWKDKDTLVKIIIDTVFGINRAAGHIIKGNVGNLQAGNLLEITNWTSSDAPLLKLYIPTTELNDAAITNFVAVAGEIKKTGKAKWTTDLEKTDPYTSIYFDKGKWFVNNYKKPLATLGAFSANNISAQTTKDSSLYIEFPASKKIGTLIRERLSRQQNIQIVNNAADAQYSLYGILNNNGLVYGFRRIQLAARDSLGSMPVQTRGFSLADTTTEAGRSLADSLYTIALRLSKLRGWLQMSGPQGGGGSFAYHLELQNKITKQSMQTGSYRIGEELSLQLVANENYLAYAGSKKYIYVFAIDKYGNMQLCYPSEADGNMNNRFPKYDNSDNMIADKSFELMSFTATEPAGTDNFFLLATDDPIPDYDRIFNQQGVQTNNASRGVSRDHPLSSLLDIGNEGSRGVPKKMARNWSLQRTSFTCTH
jgi:hypothetical protein